LRIGRRSGHEDPQFAQIAQGSSSRQSRDPSARPHLRHQQDEPSLQGAPGLSPRRPRAVIFDVGNVLYEWDPRFLYRTLIDDPARLDHFLRHVVTPEWHFQHDAGRPFAETSAELIAAYPEYSELIAVFGPRFCDMVPHPLPGMVALVEALDRARVPLFAITNFSAEFWPPFRAREASLFDRFRDVVVSGTERMVKPQPAIFELALQRFELGAARRCSSMTARRMSPRPKRRV